jgi:hypothetical protein
MTIKPAINQLRLYQSVATRKPLIELLIILRKQPRIKVGLLPAEKVLMNRIRLYKNMEKASKRLLRKYPLTDQQTC